ncbi:hypothetical protein BU25DRAFT_494514 [Macroventuria anomochaeta]|uniref:Uncharacterized protein n=1 Tax=Macroventuria anomochaeta TaxID=301207 RepID=A0ACB6RMP5_9PLEO|nr:uncharacterized protein BU25DRAFT_494514 [Macroventuria anomochaeta]KAF2623073.1 hypothetical protein BU25DRAFT_494514 [Macroventuria anomochaeta]
MATLSPSKARTTPGCGPTAINHERHSPQRAALIPRSALPEPGQRGSVNSSPHTVSLSAVQAMQAFNSDNARDGTFLLSTEGPRQGSRHEVVSMTNTCDSDVETVHGSSEASIDIITERETITYGDVKFTSPRKPLPAQWLPPSTSPSLATAQRAKAHHGAKGSTSGSPADRKSLRTTRSFIDIGKAHADGASFLTKEALDAVDANITSATLRRSPSKIQRSPTKVPWNSPTVSPKVGSLRQSAASPIKPSPPRTTHLGTHVTADHRRAPSSIVSSGATSFHTAHGSPVRSPAFSQSSFSSAENLLDSPHSYYSDTVADVILEQIDPGSKPTISTSRTTTSLRTRASRPELSISIPPPDTTIDAKRKSASTLGSATSSSGASIIQGDSPELQHPGGRQPPVSATQSSRIPRMSISKGSSARAPTLSSTLKQTKSTQALRSPKTTNGETELKRVTTFKVTGVKSMRHVRTVDSAGSTPILSERRSHKFSIPASVASVATTETEATARPGNVDLLTSYLQDTALGVLESADCLPVSSTTSRATSTSTVRAPQTDSGSVIMDMAATYSHRKPDDPGNVHSSDADDEYDDTTTSVPGSRDSLQNASPTRGRSAQYNPSVRRATTSEISMQSSSTSDLRATAVEFVPARKDTSENVEALQTPAFPDMYALDGYGIPWFYHMYPAPWLFPSIYAKGRSSKSPKKFRPKKQRSTLSSPVDDQQGQHDVLPSIETEMMESATNAASCEPDGSSVNAPSPNVQKSTAAPGNMSVPGVAAYVKASAAPFSTQFDMIARQAALQTSTNAMRPRQIDLTTIRNVPAQDVEHQGHIQGYNTMPSRRRNQRQAGNGLYGGRSNVGVPLYATAPFPNPVPPMGRPSEHSRSDPKPYVGYAVGTQACDTIEIEKAAEHGGGQACNTCEPDH